MQTPLLASSGPNFDNLPACRQDLDNASKDSKLGSRALLPTNGSVGHWIPEVDNKELLIRVNEAIRTFPTPYQKAIEQSLIKLLEDGPIIKEIQKGYSVNDEESTSIDIIYDLAQAILSRGAKQEWLPKETKDSISAENIRKVTRAYQEIISDLLREWSKNVGRELSFLAAPVKFGYPNIGPYTYTLPVIDAVFQSFEFPAASEIEKRTFSDVIQKWKLPIINLTPGSLTGGLLEMASLGHEDVGHNVVQSIPGLKDELAKKIVDKFSSPDETMKKMGTYWGNRVDETASDIMGFLHGGPAIALAFVVSLPGVGTLLTSTDTLTDKYGEHPLDVLRAYTALHVINTFNIPNISQYEQKINELINISTKNEKIKISIEGKADFYITKEQASDSAKNVVEVILTAQLTSLGSKSLSSIRTWNQADQDIVERIRKNMFVGQREFQLTKDTGEYAFHAVAAGISEAMDSRTYLKKKGIEKVQLVFQQTIDVLAKMHQHNPHWKKMESLQLEHRDPNPLCSECVIV